MRDLNFFSKTNLYKKIITYIILISFLFSFLFILSYKKLSNRTEYNEKLAFLEEDSNLEKEKELIRLRESLEKEEALSKNSLDRPSIDTSSNIIIVDFLLEKSKKYIEIENIFLNDRSFNIRARSKKIEDILNYKKALENRDDIYEIKLVEIRNNEAGYELMISFNLEELYESTKKTY